jgi:hypothetical protein
MTTRSNIPVVWTQMLPCEDLREPVTCDLVKRAFLSVRKQRAHLRQMSTEQIADRLGRLHQRLLADDAAELKAWAPAISEVSGLSEPMVVWSLQDLLGRMTARTMIALVEAEFGIREPFGAPQMLSTHACARGANPPASVFHVLAGTVPTVSVEAIVLALLARAPNVIKTSRNECHVARFYLKALREVAPDLATSIAVLTWAGGDEQLERAACDEAGVVVAYGSNSTIDSMYGKCRFPTKFIGYGHRVSFGLLTASGHLDSGTGPPALRQLCRDFALDASAYDQAGCMSMNCLFVHSAAPFSIRDVAQMMAEDAFPWVESFLPRGRIAPSVAAAQMQLIGVADFEDRAFVAPTGSAITHHGCRFEPSPGGRLLNVVPYNNDEQLLDALTPLRGTLSTVSMDCGGAERAGLTLMLSRLGVRRVVRPGRMQRPLWQRDHDGRPRIADWVDWTDVEP